MLPRYVAEQNLSAALFVLQRTPLVSTIKDTRFLIIRALKHLHRFSLLEPKEAFNQAASEGLVDIMEELYLEVVPRLDFRDMVNFLNPVKQAIANNHLNVVKFLLEPSDKHLSIGPMSCMFGVLMKDYVQYAVEKEKFDIVEYLITSPFILSIDTASETMQWLIKENKVDYARKIYYNLQEIITSVDLTEEQETILNRIATQL